MSDPMSSAELDAQHVALLPARTVLSLLRADGAGADGADGPGTAGRPGDPGHPGSPGESIQGSGKTITYDHVEQTGTSTGS